MTGHFRRLIAQLVAGFAAAVSFIALPGTAQAAHWYYDNTLGDVSAEEKIVPEAPAPVQLLFEFQRDGAPHPKATKEVKPMAIKELKAIGVFSDVVEKPVEGGAVLSIKFNNVVDQEALKKAKKDGFGAGLGFGLFGGVFTTDHYVVTMEYIPATGADGVSAEVTHALYMTYGKQKKDLVIPGTEVKNANAAVQNVVRQSLARGVNDIFAKLKAPSEANSAPAALPAQAEQASPSIEAAPATEETPIPAPA